MTACVVESAACGDGVDGWAPTLPCSSIMLMVNFVAGFHWFLKLYSIIADCTRRIYVFMPLVYVL